MEYKVITTNELYHHGIKGQKWGVRRYQNADGSLTEEGKRHKDNFVNANLLARKVANEGQKLINQDKRLSYDFGGNYLNVDDDEFFELQAREYGLNTKAFWDANQTYSSFVKQNYESIKIGREIIAELIKQEKSKN